MFPRVTFKTFFLIVKVKNFKRTGNIKYQNHQSQELNYISKQNINLRKAVSLGRGNKNEKVFYIESYRIMTKKRFKGAVEKSLKL